MSDEPSTDEFAESAVDTVASTSLAQTLKKKALARNYWEFFNRLWTVSALLLGTGFGGLVVLVVFLNYEVTFLDLTNGVVIVIGAAVLAAFFELVKATETGEDLLSGESEPNRGLSLLKAGFGLIVISAMAYSLVIQEYGIVQAAIISLAAIAITGTWLFGLAWLFGGLSGYYRATHKNESREE